MRKTLTTAAALALFGTQAGADAGAELAERLAKELGIETRSLHGLTGPAGLQSEALTDTRTLDPAGAHPALEGYLFRSRYIVVGPNGMVPLHSHDTRPAFTYIMNGAITEMRSDAEALVIRRAGEHTVDFDIAQWWHNDGDEPVFIFVGDLCPEGGDPACTLEPTSPAAAPDYAPAGEIDWPEGAGTATIDGYDGPARLVDETVTVLAEIDLAEALGEVEGLGDLSGLRLRARRVEVNPGGIVPLHAQPDRPAYFVVTEGNLTYYGPEGTLTLGPSETFEDFGPNPNWWRNEGAVPVTLFAVDVVAS